MDNTNNNAAGMLEGPLHISLFTHFLKFGYVDKNSGKIEHGYVDINTSPSGTTVEDTNGK